MRKYERFNVLKDIYSSYSYIAETVVGAAIYYLFYITVVGSQGIFLFITTPIYLIYLLIITSAILLTIATFVIRKSAKAIRSAYAGGAYSLLASVFGGLIASCGCEMPFFTAFLYLIGLNALEITGFISFVNSYKIYIVSAFIIANVFLSYYYLGKATPSFDKKVSKKTMSKIFVK
ncbi:MAG: hypothetical protein ACP5FN_00580 [Candidatus Micrarchaeia archaeon]